MTTQIKRRRGTTTEHSTFTGAEGELTIDTTKDTVVVHDGSTAGGHPLAKESSIAGKVDTSGDTMTGDLTVPNLIVSGNVDGRDVSADGTKLDGIEAGADVTDTANVSAAGAAMETGAAFTGNVTFGDNDKAIFGAGSDLQIYHDGSNSIITDLGTGKIEIQSNGTGISLQKGATENLATFLIDGAVNLYYDNSKKLATTSTGVDITGTLTSDGLLVEGEVAGQGASIEAHATVTEFGDALLIAKSDNASNNLHAGVKIQGSNNPFYIYQTNGSNTNKLRFNYNAMSDAGGQMTIDYNGDLSLYDSTGTTPKFFWDASAEKLLIGDTSNSTASGLYIKTADPTDLFTGQLVLKGTALTGAADTGASIVFEGFNGSGNRTLGSIQSLKENSAVGDSLAYMRFSTFGSSGTQERMRIDSSGRVGIGTSSPSEILTLDDTDPKLAFRDAGTERAFLQVDTSDNFVINNKSLSNMIFETGDTERMRIDSSGNVGIGTSSPAANLEITDSIELPSVSLSSTGTDHMGLITGTVSSMMAATTGNNILFAHQPFANRGTFSNFTERMRIDSSGNLLVGKTSDNNALEGISLASTGAVKATNSSDLTGIFNRLSTDGDIVQFWKDGTTVGSIGVSGQLFAIGRGDTTLGFDDANDAIYARGTSGAYRPDAISLGASNNRFKDLYLSGGVYLGGTGAANKLDDYEEGTFSLTLGGVSGGAFGAGKYVKIGALVHFQWYSGGSISVTDATASFTGLPFTSVPTPYYSVFYAYHNTYCPTSSGGYINVNSNSGVFTALNSDTGAPTNGSPGRYLMLAGSYYTDA